MVPPKHTWKGRCIGGFWNSLRIQEMTHALKESKAHLSGAWCGQDFRHAVVECNKATWKRGRYGFFGLHKPDYKEL